MRRRQIITDNRVLPELPNLGRPPKCSSTPRRLPCSTCPSVTTFNARLGEFRQALVDLALDPADITERRSAAGRRIYCPAAL